MHLWTLRVRFNPTRSVEGGITTRSVGTIIINPFERKKTPTCAH
jgi:hypothetical protein